jgi:hypothetical protein
MQFTLSTNTIIWKTRHLSNTINLVFMINWLVNNVVNCETRFDLNQSSNHISIFITFTFEINFVSIKQKKAWKRVDVEKLRSNLRLFIVSSSLNFVEQMKMLVPLRWWYESSQYIDSVVYCWMSTRFRLLPSRWSICRGVGHVTSHYFYLIRLPINLTK